MFDAKAKTLLLEADQNIQMHSAMQEAAARGSFFGLPIVPQYLVLEVRRENVVNDTINELSRCAAADLKKPLKVLPRLFSSSAVCVIESYASDR